MVNSMLGRLGVVVCLSFFSSLVQADFRLDPERATGWRAQTVLKSRTDMVVSANPLASEAGVDVLRQGGTAIDALVAVQGVLGLVEPQSSGLGGGGFILYYHAASQKLYTLDAREKAPAAAHGDLFIENGEAIRWIEAVVGGRSVGVPGILRGLESAHQRFGKLPWGELWRNPINLAEDGFRVSPRLHDLVVKGWNPGLKKLAPARDYFYPEGKPLSVGTNLQNPEYARTLRHIAAEGADYFYRGPLAATIANTVQRSAVRPGLLSVDDLANYQPVWREPLCRPFRRWQVCGMPMPSSGGLAVLQQLAMMDVLVSDGREVNEADYWHLFTQTSRLAFADRQRYAADSDFADVPIDHLLNSDYLRTRSRLVNSDRDMGKAQPGVLADLAQMTDDDAIELPSTSHVVIVDKYGNAVSMTSSIEMAFGSGLMVGGFLLNNQLTDFSFHSHRNGVPVANRIEGGKRPRSSMAPFIVLDKDSGAPVMLLGSPGGSRIINYVGQAMLAYLDRGLSLQAAIELPHVTNRNDKTAVEQGAPEQFIEAFRARGHDVEVRDLNSGIHALVIDGDIIQSGVDPRREGVAMSSVPLINLDE